MPTCASALLWSSRVRHVMFSGAMSGAYSLRMSALVLAGLATTSTWKGESEGDMCAMCIHACVRACVGRGERSARDVARLKCMARKPRAP